MYLMVLNEGQTYSSLDGCRIVHAPDDLAPHEIAHELTMLGFEDCKLTKVRTFGPIPIEEEWNLGAHI